MLLNAYITFILVIFGTITVAIVCVVERNNLFADLM